MAGAKRSTWVGATVFGAVVIAAATWFGLVSPVEANAADLRAQTENTRTTNLQLQKKVDQLKKDFAKLPEYQKQLADLQIQIPTTAQLSEYIREVNTIATARSVTVVNIAPAEAQVFQPAAPVVTAPSPAPTTNPTADPTVSTDESTPAPKKPATPAGPTVPDGFVAIPVAFDVVGTYDNTVAFVSDLQTATPRLFLLTQLTATSQLTDQPAQGGKPTLHVGDEELTLSGFLYVLPDSSAAAAPAPSASATPTAPALPPAVPGKNPLVPVAGK